MSVQKYLDMLTESHIENDRNNGQKTSREEYILCEIFDVAAYSSDVATILARAACEIACALSDRTTFMYISPGSTSEANYTSVLHWPFFAERVDWGTSIRGAFWRFSETRLDSCGLYKNGEQLIHLEFSRSEWDDFIKACSLYVNNTLKGTK